MFRALEFKFKVYGFRSIVSGFKRLGFGLRV